MHRFRDRERLGRSALASRVWAAWLSTIILHLCAATPARAGNIFDDDWTPPARQKPVGPEVGPAPSGPASNPSSATFPSGPSLPTTMPVQVVPVAAARLAIPAEADLAKSRKALRDLFVEDLADRSTDGRRALFSKLLKLSTTSTDVQSDQFVLLAAAIEAGKDASDMGLCIQAADAMAAAFDVDGLRLKCDAAWRMALRGDSPMVRDDNCRETERLIEQLIVADDFAWATRLSAAICAIQTTDRTLGLQIQRQAKEIETQRIEAAALAKISETLKVSPNDAAANLSVGLILCFKKEQWDRGLPLLAKGSDAMLSALARGEIDKPTDPAAQLELADGWWGVAEKLTDRSKIGVRKHSVYWYRIVLPQLRGLMKSRVEQRIGEAGFRGSPVGEVRRFTGDGKSVHAVVFSPDGRYVIFGGGSDNTIRKCEVSSGREISQFTGHTGMISKLSLSADGRVLASGSHDGTARVWDVATAKPTRSFKHRREVESVALSADGRFLIVGDFGGHPVLYDLPTGKPVAEFGGEGGYAGAFSSNGNYCATGGWDGVTHIWDMRTPIRQIFQIKQGNQIKAMAFAPNEATVLSGGHDLTAHLYDVASGQELQRFVGHTGNVHGVAFSPDGRTCLTASEDHTARLWNIATGNQLMNFDSHDGKVWAVVFSPDGSLAASACDDGIVRLWKLPGGE